MRDVTAYHAANALLVVVAAARRVLDHHDDRMGTHIAEPLVADLRTALAALDRRST